MTEKTSSNLENLNKDKKDTPRIFLSYKRDVEPDTPLAIELYEALSKQYDMFIDQKMILGTQWAEKIEEELRNSDYLITLLSEKSIHSEMVKGEIERAHKLAKERDGYPKILPIRVAFRNAFPYPLNIYLDNINWTVWNDASDTPGLVEELREALNGGTLPPDSGKRHRKDEKSHIEEHVEPTPSAQPIRVQLEMPEGTMAAESKFYIERDGDDIALEAIKQQGVTITIQAPRQMGKSSLLIRTMKAAQDAGKKVAFLDFQLFDKSALTDADTFFRQFCAFVTYELGVEDKIDAYWKAPFGNSQRCTRYFNLHLLKELDGPLLLAMDEVETVFNADFQSDFFGMLRNWHNSRATDPIWKQLDLTFVTSTEPYQLIDNLNQSPFNVGENIELLDFTFEQIQELNKRHGSPLIHTEIEELNALLGGHPYLSRRALYLITSKRISISELFDKATNDRGPFGDHLRYHLFRLHGKDKLIKGFLQVLKKNVCHDQEIFFRLRGAGLVGRKNGIVEPRCKLYADYFGKHLDGS